MKLAFPPGQVVMLMRLPRTISSPVNPQTGKKPDGAQVHFPSIPRVVMPPMRMSHE